jgi:hypothetical protein
MKPTLCRSCRVALLSWALTLMAVLGGCAQTATYNAAYLTPPATAAADKLTGQALVYTVQADDDTLWSGKPTSFTGSATTLTIPLGMIAREVAALVFGNAFQGGAVKAHTLAGASGYRVIVQPRISNFSYEYDALTNAGFAVTPTVSLTLDLALLDAAGKTVQQRRYDSGKVVTAAYFVSGSPGEEIGKAAHKAVFDLMTQAARDVREWLRLRGDGPLSL